MGRPIKKSNFGDTADAGNQIVITGDIGGGVFTGFIVRQKSTREFIANLNGVEGRVRLVGNASPGVGEAYIEIFEDGADADGNGADFTANLQLATASVNNPGTSGTAATTNTLTLAGGTFATASTLDVTGVGGTPVGVTAFTILDAGNYSVLPASPNTVATDGSGVGATIDLDTWSVDTATSVAGGALYDQAPIVTISGGGGTGATATAAISGGAVTGLTIDTAGSAFTTIPTISFVNAGRKFVERIKQNKVNATDGVQTQWDTTLGATPPAGQSRIVAS